MAGSSRKDFKCITTGYPLQDYQVCSVVYRNEVTRDMLTFKGVMKKKMGLPIF